MHQVIKLEESVTVTVETRAIGRVRLSLAHAWFDMDRVDMTAAQALALSRALLLAHDLLTGAESPLQAGPSGAKRNAGEGAQGGHPQRLPGGEVPVKSMTTEQCLGYLLKYSAKGAQNGRMNWLAMVMLGALAGFWVAFGMAIKTAIEAGAVVL